MQVVADPIADGNDDIEIVGTKRKADATMTPPDISSTSASLCDAEIPAAALDVVAGDAAENEKGCSVCALCGGVQLAANETPPQNDDSPPAAQLIPDVIFVVGYRDRVQQRAFFQNHMVNTILAGMPAGQHLIWFIHQCDERRFNRGAIKNIGVRIAQDLYPDHWRDITFVFNDVDTMPFSAHFFDFVTCRGVVKHFFGFTFALGGIVSITGHDFDLVNGFPCLFAWGYEDNTLQDRCAAAHLLIDRSNFYPIMDKNVMQFPDGKTRSLNRTEYDRYAGHQLVDGLYDVFDIQYHDVGAATADGGELVLLPSVHQFDVTAFTTTVPEPTTADDELVFGKGTHPFLNALQASQTQQHPLRSLFGNMLAAKKM